MPPLDPRAVLAKQIAAAHGGESDPREAASAEFDALHAPAPAAEPAPDAAATPAPAEPGAPRVNVVAPDGKTVSVPSANLAAAEKAGYKRESKEAATKRVAQDYASTQDQDGTGGFDAFGRSYLDSFSMGVTGAIDAHRDNAQVKANKEAVDEAHPLAHYTGMGLGFVANAAATGALSLGAKVLQGGSLAARMLGRAAASTVGETLASSAARTGTEAIAERSLFSGAAAATGEQAAAEAAATAATEGASTKAAETLGARVAKGALHSAAAGAAYAAPAAITHLAYHDPQAAAETVLMGAGIGGVLGGALGGVTGLAAARRALRSPGAGPAAGAIESSLQKAEGETAEHLATAMSEPPAIDDPHAQPSVLDQPIGQEAPVADRLADRPGAVPDESGVLPKTPESGGGIAGQPANAEPTSGERAVDVAKDAVEETANNEAQDAAGVGTGPKPGPEPIEAGPKEGTRGFFQRRIKGADAQAEKTILANFQDPEEQEAARRMFKEGGHNPVRDEAALDHVTRNVASAGTDILKAQRAIQLAAFGESKANQMAKLVPRENTGAAITQVAEIFKDVHATIGELDALHDQGGVGVELNRLKKQFAWLDKGASPGGGELDRILAGVGRGVGSKTDNQAANLFMMTDQLKRGVGKAAKFGKNVIGAPGAQVMDDLYMRIAKQLESEEVWGRAGAAQRDVNDATTNMLSSIKQFNAQYTVETGSSAGRPVYEFDPGKMKGLLRNPEGAENDLAHRYANVTMEGMQRQLDTIERHYALDASTKTEFAQGRKAIKSFGEQMADARKEARIVSKGKRMVEREESAQPSIFRRGLSAVPAIGNTLDAAFEARQVYNPKTSTPLQSLERLAQIKHAAGQASEAIDGLHPLRVGAETLSKASDHVIKAVAKAPDIFTGGTTRSADVSSSARTMARYLGVPIAKMKTTSAITVEQYQKVQEHLNKVTSDPGHDARTAARGMSDALSAVNPKVGEAYGNKLTGVTRYLHDALPKEPVASNPFIKSDPVPPTAAQLQEFSDKLRVCMDPTSIYHSVWEGSLTDAEMDAATQNYPSILGAMRQTTMEWASENPEKAQSLKPGQLSSLGKFLSMNMQQDGSADSAQFFQKRYGPGNAASQPPQAQGPSPAGGTTAPARFTIPDQSTSIDKITGRGGQ